MPETVGWNGFQIDSHQKVGIFIYTEKIQEHSVFYILIFQRSP